METWLARLAGAVARRRRLVIGAWLLLVLGSVWFSLHQSDHLSGGGWEISGSQEARSTALLRTFSGYTTPAYSVFIRGRSSDQVAARRRGAAEIVRRQPRLEVGPSYTLDGGRAALLPISFEGSADAAIDVATSLRDELVETTPESSTRLSPGTGTGRPVGAKELGRRAAT